MSSHTSIPYSLNSGNIKKDIKAIKNWVDADLKYQIWSLNINTHTNKQLDRLPPTITDKKQDDNTPAPTKKADQ